jgi:YVTN family beta-propeller protein
MAEVETIVVGDEPHGVVTDVSGGTLYVANAGSSDVSVVDLESRREVKRLSAGRGTWGVSRSPDGGEIFVTNNLSHFVPFRAPSRSEVTVIGTERAMVGNRVMIAEANLVQGVDVAPSGEFALVTLIRTKNLVPMTRVLQGWVITNGIGVLWRDGRVDQLLLDEPGDYFADPTDVVITPDGRLAFVTGGGIDAVAVVDLERMRAVLDTASEEDRRELLPNHLGVSTEFVERRIQVGRNPRGLAVSPDGRFVYVAEALDDTVAVIDVVRRERVATIDLGGPDETTLTRKGERIFHSAEVTFGHQFSCHSCHPDGGIDAITYDIEPDGIGINPVDNRTLRGILDTAPFKWTGKNPTISRQCGPRLAVFFTRIDPFTPDQVAALDRYIRTIPRNPNRYRVGDELTPAQRRGQALFERTLANSGAEIPVADRCSNCHPAPYFTSREQVSVGTASELDTHDVFDIPHLNNIYESAPYLHDGRADTLEEIWTRFNPNDEHGVTNDMTKDQLNDLIEYLKTL